MRLFVAVDPGQRCRDELTPWLDARADLDAVRWVRPELLHVTLRFLGEQPAAAVAALGKALQRTVTGVHAFPVPFGPPDIFPARGRPRVLFLPLRSDGALEELAARTAAALAPWRPGDDARETTFRAHLTLGRVRRDAPRDLTPRLRELADPRPTPFTASAVDLVRSVLGPAGPRYEVLASFPLAEGQSRL